MEKDELARRLFEAAHITGEFRLRSGQVSGEYFDKYLFEARPALLSGIAKRMEPLIPAGTEVLAGLEMGGIAVTAALSMLTGIEAAFVRKKAKGYGTMKLCEGAAVEGRKVCIVEDVVTTGGQIIESAGELRRLGADINGVVCVIRRSPAAADILAKDGLELLPAFTMEYIKEQAGAAT